MEAFGSCDLTILMKRRPVEKEVTYHIHQTSGLSICLRGSNMSFRSFIRRTIEILGWLFELLQLLAIIDSEEGLIFIAWEHSSLGGARL